MPPSATYPSLKGRTVFITGGASGIGASLVELFAWQGARIGFVDLADDAAAALGEKAVEAGGTKPWYRHCDITDIPALREAISEYAALCPYALNVRTPLFYGARGKRLQAPVLRKQVQILRGALGLTETATPHASDST